jgi:hypothetical protein
MGGDSLRRICADRDMPDKSQVFRWLNQYGTFRDQYARAREIQTESLIDEIIEIADDASQDAYVDADGKRRVDHEAVQRSKLRIDARKWFASKLLPKKYGDSTMLKQAGAYDANPPEFHFHMLDPK